MPPELQLIDDTRTGSGFNAYLVTKDSTHICDWSQPSNMTRAEAIRLARLRGFEPTIRHAHQVWLRCSATAIARHGYEAHDAGVAEHGSPHLPTSSDDMAWRAGWHMAARGYVAPSLNERDAVCVGRGNRVHVRDQLWRLAREGGRTRVMRER
jgi:hypothetical protein